VDRLGRGAGTSRRKSGKPKCGKGANFGNSADGIFRGVALVVPRTSRAAEVRVECVSNVIYQNVYLIRLIYISGFLSN